MIQLSAPPAVAPSPPRKSRSITLSPRQRQLLHTLLHRNAQKCSAATMDAFRKFGWACGAGVTFELTEKGRQIAEISERSPLDQSLDIEVS